MKSSLLGGIHAPATQGRDTKPTACKRPCCWSPYGHSTARDGIPKFKGGCDCHNTAKEQNNA